MSEATPAAAGPAYSDILDLARRVQKDVADAQAKLVTITGWLAAQPDADRHYNHVCPVAHCKTGFLTQARLDEHLANVHGEAA